MSRRASFSDVIRQAKLARFVWARVAVAVVIVGCWLLLLATGDLGWLAGVAGGMLVWMEDSLGNWRAPWARPRAVIALAVCVGSIVVGSSPMSRAMGSAHST